MTGSLLFVGLAADGPSNIPIKISDERTLLRTFGGIWTQRETITSAASSVSLYYEAYSPPANIVDSKPQYLYSPTATGTVYYFGTIGGTGNHVLDIVYTPYFGKNDLLFALRKHLETTGRGVYGMRIGGSKATGSFAGWIVESVYAGAKYNSVAVALTATGLQISGLEPNYATLSYSFSSSGAWNAQFQRDYELGLSPIRIQTMGSTNTTFSFTLSGGTNGSFSDSEISEFFDVLNLPANISHIVLLTPASSSIIENIYSLLWDTSNQPRMFLLPAPTFTSPASSWATTMQTTLPSRHNLIGLVVGDTLTSLQGRTVSRFAAEGAAIGLSKADGYNLTNTPVDAVGFSPLLTEVELDNLKARGFMSLMRYIRNDICVYEGVTSAAENSFLFSSKVAEIYSVTYKLLTPLLGAPIISGDQPQLTATLRTALSQINYIIIDTVEVVAFYDSLSVKITAILPHEILSIQFTIKNRPVSI